VAAKRESRLVNRRIRLLLLLIVAGFAALLARAAWVGVVEAASLSVRAQTQQNGVLLVPASRGTIFDRTGVPLALGEQATTVYADPQQLRNPRRAATIAARILGLHAPQLMPLLTDRKRGFVYVERKADPARAAALARRDIPGFGFQPEERRAYPQRSVAAQVLGFAGTDNHGLAGLEEELDRQLSGVDGSQTVVRDPAGNVIDVVKQRPARHGRNVFLTVDHTIQANAEQVLRATVAKWHAKAASAIVLDPATGAVLAMADMPSYDANRYPQASLEAQRNRAVTDMYEPGSTFKVVTVGGALSDRIVTPGTRFTLPYSIQVADRVIHDAEPRGTETMTVSQILAHSSNVGAITLAEHLGPQRLMQWISRFGFGKQTGIDFPGEAGGLVLPLDRWSGSTIGNVPIGQGISVTPIQMASVYAALANGGVWVQPHLVERVQGLAPRPPVRRRILSPQVDSELMSMLKGVVLEGTGQSAAIPGYQVAGKTGTAQVADGHGGYASGKYIASFVGIVPASRPRLVVLVKVDEPQGGIYGAEVAAPAFEQIASAALQYLEIPPDAPVAVTPGAAVTTTSG
jgi:cell division protein FtsI (penicillin-binding protein 3)